MTRPSAFRIGIVAATVDAVHAEAGFDAYPEMLRQVAAADRLIVTRTAGGGCA